MHRIRPDLILLIGEPKSGKSYVRERLCEHLQIKGGSCSDVIFDVLAHRLRHRETGLNVEALRKIPKDALRPILIATGNELCARDPARLACCLVKAGCQVIDGVRRLNELHEIKRRFNCFTVWIDPDPWEATHRAPVRDNTEVSIEHADTVFINYHFSLHFERELGRILSYFRAPNLN